MTDYWKRLNEVYRTPSPPAPPGEQRERLRPGPSPIPGRPPEQADEAAARRTLWFLAAGVGVLVLGLVVFFTVRTIRNDDGASGGAQSVRSPEDAAKVVGGLGPPPGVNVAEYISARQGALATATGDRLAVVSLNSYTNQDAARSMVGSVEVVALLAAAPGGQPSVVTGDIAAWAEAQTADARAERDEIQRLIPTVEGDPGFRNFYRSEVERLDSLVASVSPDGDLVFGVVVRAPAPALQQLAGKEDVRLVDVAANAQRNPRAEYRGLRPEETEKANTPNTRPL